MMSWLVGSSYGDRPSLEVKMKKVAILLRHPFVESHPSGFIACRGDCLYVNLEWWNETNGWREGGREQGERFYWKNLVRTRYNKSCLTFSGNFFHLAPHLRRIKIFPSLLTIVNSDVHILTRCKSSFEFRTKIQNSICAVSTCVHHWSTTVAQTGSCRNFRPLWPVKVRIHSIGGETLRAKFSWLSEA